ncbi:MAG: flagellar hook-associated protein FlgK [Leptospiraceae bacterium]|nr:flagellar hook-associated protein FlgK [Leptospiraceae bacterium]
MGSTFSGFEVSKRGLSTHQQALHTLGHNVSNADNKAYARQRVQMSTMEPLYDPSLNRAKVAGQIGQGSVASYVERIRDFFIDEKINLTMTEKNYWSAREEYLREVEIIFGEPQGQTLRNQMDQFWSAWEELANFPDESAHRAVVKEKAIGLGNRIEDTFKKLTSLKEQANREVEIKTRELNQIAESIRVLNEKITKLEALGDNPNDLYDKRDKLVEDLSALVDITIGRSDEDEFMIFIGQQILVQGSKKNEIELVGNADYEGKLDLFWKHNKERVILKSGRLQGLIEVRDFVLTEKIAELDSLAINLMDTVNSIHRDGFGINGKTNLDFFEKRSLSGNALGEYDFNGDGINDTTAIFRVTGRTSLDKDKPIGISGIITLLKNDEKNTPVLIPYSQDDTVADVVQRINNARAGVVASLNHDNQLTLKATISEAHPRKNFMIQHLEDSGNFLVGFSGILASSGTVGAFDARRVGELNKFQAQTEDITFTPFYHPASYVKLNKEIANDVNSIAAARGKDVGGVQDYNKPHGYKDGSNALLIASALRENKVMVEYQETFNGFYSFNIAKLGVEAREAKQEAELRKSLLTEFENLRQSVMGVSLDEEMALMVQFQQSYNASAKVLNMQNELLDVIINRLGR